MDIFYFIRLLKGPSRLTLNTSRCSLSPAAVGVVRVPGWVPPARPKLATRSATPGSPPDPGQWLLSAAQAGSSAARYRSKGRRRDASCRLGFPRSAAGSPEPVRAPQEPGSPSSPAGGCPPRRARTQAAASGRQKGRGTSLLRSAAGLLLPPGPPCLCREFCYSSSPCAVRLAAAEFLLPLACYLRVRPSCRSSLLLLKFLLQLLLLSTGVPRSALPEGSSRKLLLHTFCQLCQPLPCETDIETRATAPPAAVGESPHPPCLAGEPPAPLPAVTGTASSGKLPVSRETAVVGSLGGSNSTVKHSSVVHGEVKHTSKTLKMVLNSSRAFI
ncbi:uncharacterized protein LOC132322434 [Haemorhous mexicanus]|uniref:uncharacterized protein LOC132322434 n=1 Tax=Haemorhous mexicanus TaxID=30427 RepID=UPI0028BE2250|nr:uncharacterized protein LOC132322434 [Haemorhous mexicanus]